MNDSTLLPGESLNDNFYSDGKALDALSIPRSAVSWSAIAAGSAAAASLSLILLILGVGLGLSSVSPWSNEGMRAGTFGLSTIAWLTLTQLVASGVGGYLAGRLRTRWAGVHRNEVYFRDTAHGFLSWAVAALVTAVLLTSTIGSIVGTGIQAGATALGSVGTVAAEAAVGPSGMNADTYSDRAPMAYFIDTLFRRDMAASRAARTDSAAGVAAMTDNAVLTEAARIFMNASRSQPLPADDVRYLGLLVAQRTGLPQADAEKRVSDTYAKAQARLNEAEIAARQGTDSARKASAYAALWLFVSLLVGAFFASLAATVGGQQRDKS